MKAIILAAGMSKRLYPITLGKPKCLLEIGGTSIIEYQISALKEVGITEIIVVVGYHGNQIVDKIQDNCVKFVSNNKYETTNSGYSLWLAKKHLIDSDFIYLNSDLYFSIRDLKNLLLMKEDFTCVIDQHRKNKCQDSFKAIIKSDDMTIFDMGKEIISSVEVPGPFYLNQKVSSELFQLLENMIEFDKNMWVYSIFNKLAESIPLAGIQSHGKWFEIDTIEDFSEANDANKI
jgi:L-glutamine-phosphate cytidylyltransferase